MKLICLLVRRVKCDEAKPCCHACLSTGRKCDGYGPNMAALPDLSSVLFGALNLSPSLRLLRTERERESFYFFRQKTAPQLSGFFEDDFWERLLLQAAHHEPSLRHAILALGSLHANCELDNCSTMQNHNNIKDDFALKNYNQAINMLVKPLSQESHAIDVFLICSILFACLEVSRSYTKTLPVLIISRQYNRGTASLSRMSKAA